MFPIYIITFSLLWEQLLPPILRKSRQLAWGTSLLKPLQDFRDRIFNLMIDGSTDPVWNSITSYNISDRVVYIDRGVYRCISPIITNPPTDINYWIQESDEYIGIRERVKYNSQKILFEYGLNRFFQVSHVYANSPLNSTGIYIVNTPVSSNIFTMGQTGQYSSSMANDSQYSTTYLAQNYSILSLSCFTIFVPIVVFNSLAATNIDRENIVRNFADQYVIGGMIYTVATY